MGYKFFAPPFSKGSRHRDISAAAGRPPTPPRGQGHRDIPAVAGRSPTPPMGHGRSYAAGFPSPLLRDGGHGGTPTAAGRSPQGTSVLVPGTAGCPAWDPRVSPLVAPGRAPDVAQNPRIRGRAQGAAQRPPLGKRGRSPDPAEIAAKRSKGYRACPFRDCGAVVHNSAHCTSSQTKFQNRPQNNDMTSTYLGTDDVDLQLTEQSMGSSSVTLTSLVVSKKAMGLPFEKVRALSDELVTSSWVRPLCRVTIIVVGQY